MQGHDFATHTVIELKRNTACNHTITVDRRDLLFISRVEHREYLLEIGETGWADRTDASRMPVKETDFMFWSERNHRFINIIDDRRELRRLKLLPVLCGENTHRLLQRRSDRDRPTFQKHRLDIQIARRFECQATTDNGFKPFLDKLLDPFPNVLLISLRENTDPSIENLKISGGAIEQIGSTDHSDPLESTARKIA